MSVLPRDANITPYDCLLNNINNLSFISSINVYNGTINTSQINLDSVRMDAAIINSVPTLLLNGVPAVATSSFTSSIAMWSAFPALSPITYATGVGTGGAINMANVNALSNVSSGTGTFGTLSTVGATSLNGFLYPNTGVAIASMAQSLVVGGSGLLGAFNFTGQPAGLYMVTVLLQSGGADPMTCSAVVRFSGGTALGGSLHMPSINSQLPYPTNCVSIQSDVASDANIQVYVFTQISGLIGGSAQLSAYRIT
jgi:hypothetical protein